MQAQRKEERATMRDIGLLTLRAVTGGLMVGHGAQKLFGSFGGPGIHGTAGWLESMELRPGHRWAALAGGSEFTGGLLTAVGLGGPLGPITMLGPMGMAIGKAHWGKPIWVTQGGAELPLTNVAVAIALMLAGSGQFSLDQALGIRVPKALAAVAFVGTLAGVAYGIMQRPAPPTEQQQEAGEKLQSGDHGQEPPQIRPSA